jgi:hypothetical protein
MSLRANDLSIEAADPRNVPEDFFVKKDCCLLYGIPWHFAPELVSIRRLSILGRRSTSDVR